jgi:hypothetical protein
MSWTRRSIAVAGVAAALALAGALFAAQQEPAGDPLAALEVGGEAVGWDGVRVGMSLVQAERRFGGALSLTEIPGSRCGRFAASAERNGLDLRVGFPAAKPGAKIETLFVRFEGYQIAATTADLVASLKAKQPAVRYVPDPALPDRPEATDPAPVYELPTKTPLAISLRPRDGLLIGPLACVR